MSSPIATSAWRRFFHGTPLCDIAIADVMSKTVYACKPDDDVAEAEQVMSVRQVRRLPVVTDDGTPVGMLSVSDVVQQVKPASKFQKAASAPDGVPPDAGRNLEPRSKLQAREQTQRQAS